MHPKLSNSLGILMNCPDICFPFPLPLPLLGLSWKPLSADGFSNFGRFKGGSSSFDLTARGFGCNNDITSVLSMHAMKHWSQGLPTSSCCFDSAPGLLSDQHEQLFVGCFDLLKCCPCESGRNMFQTTCHDLLKPFVVKFV